MSISSEFKNFALTVKERKPNITRQEVIDLYEQYKSQKTITVPDTQTTSKEELYGFNHTYVQDKINTKIPQEQHQSIMETYSGIDGITTAGMTGKIQEAQDVTGEPIDLIDIMNKWAGRDEYEVRREGIGEIKAAPTGFEKLKQSIYTGYRNRKIKLAETTEVALEEGGLAPAFKYIDFFPSAYRGLMQNIGLEDFDIPVIDDIAELSGRVTEGQVERQQAFLDYLGKEGYVKEAATLNTLNSIADTLTFLRRIQQIGFTKGGQTIKGAGVFKTKKFTAKRILSTLAHGQKISLFASMTAEDVTWEERKDIYLVTSLYTSTPAISGALKNPFVVKGTDFLLNTAISAGKEGGYKDIINNTEMDNFQKIMEAGNLLGHDIVFSALTKSYRTDISNYQAQSAQIDAMARANMMPTRGIPTETPRPTNTLRPLNDGELIKLEVSGDGKNYLVLDKIENQTKADIKATENKLQDDLARIEREAEIEAAKPPVEKEKPVEPKVDEVVTEKPLENKQIEKAVKQTLVETIRENKNKDPFDQAEALQVRTEQLGEVIDAPKGTKVKTVVNRINNIRQKKPAVEFKQKEYYTLLQQVSRTAAKEAIGDISKSLKLMSDFAEANLPYRQADRVKAQFQKLMESKPTPAQFADRATTILDRATGRLQTIEKVIGIKDMSKRVDMTEAEMLRVVLKESQKAATGAVKSISDKIVSSQKEAQDIIDSMPKSTRDKVIVPLRKIAKAKTDKTREKYLKQFNEQAAKVIDQYNIKQAKSDLNFAITEARRLVKSRKVRPDIAKNIEDVITATDAGKLADQLPKLKQKATSIEERQVLENIDLMLSVSKPKPISEMSAAELRLTSDALNGYVHQMNKITQELKLYSKSKSFYEAAVQKEIIVSRPEIDLDSKARPLIDLTKKFKVGGELIPRGIAESLDYFNTKGEFTKYQTKLEQSEANIYKVILSVQDIMSPVATRMSKLNFSKNADKQEFTVTDSSGQSIKIKLGVADRSRIYLGYRDIETWNESTKVGWKAGTGRKTFFVNESAYKDIENYMRKNNETEVSDAMVAAYRELSAYTDERSMEMNGYPLSIPTYTGARLRVGKNLSSEVLLKDIDLDKGRGFNEQFIQTFADSSGRFKARTGSDSPLLIYNPELMFNQTTRIVSLYYGRGSVLRDINNLLNRMESKDSYKEGESFADRYEQIGRGVEYKAYKNYIKTLNEAGSPFKGERFGEKEINKLIDSSMKYLGGRALKLNPKVASMQLASMSTAAAVMDSKYVKIMNNAFTTKPASIQEMSAKSDYLRARYDGRTGHIYSDQKISKKDERGFEMIKNMDARVIGSIYRAMEQKVIDSKKELSNEQFNKEVENLVIDVIMKTQPSFEAVSRPALAQSKNPLLRMAFAFSSQRNKLYYLNYKSAVKLINKKEMGTLNRKDLQIAGRTFGYLTINNLIISTINTTAQELMEEKLRQNFEAEGKLLREDFDVPSAERFAKNLFTANLGSLGASSSMVASLIDGFELTRTPFDAVLRDAKEFSKIQTMIYEWNVASKYGLGDEWFKQNGNNFISKTTKLGNIAVQPLTGINIANAYKWFVEAPTTLIKKAKETEIDKIQREIKEIERDVKNIPELLEIKREEKIIKDLTNNIKL